MADEVSQHCADMCIDAQMSENVRRTYAASNFRRIEEEAVYQRQSEQMMSEEHCFKIIIYPCGKITFELLASEEEESESESEEDEESNSTQSSRTLRSSGKIGTNSEVGNKKWADVDDDDDDDRSSFDRVKIDDDLLERLELNPLFLKRCVRNYKSQANISKTTKTSLQVPNNNNNKNNISQDQDDKDKEQSSTTLNEDSNSNRKFSNQDKSQNECQLSFKNFNSVVLHDDFSLCRRDSIIKAREVRSFKLTISLFKLISFKYFTFSLIKRYQNIRKENLPNGIKSLRLVILILKTRHKKISSIFLIISI